MTNATPDPKERSPTVVKKLLISNEDNFRRCVIVFVHYRPLVEICVVTDSLTLIVGRSEKFTDKYVNTSINVHVFVWKEIIALEKSRKVKYENHLLFHLCGIITKDKMFHPQFSACIKT